MTGSGQGRAMMVTLSGCKELCSRDEIMNGKIGASVAADQAGRAGGATAGKPCKTFRGSKQLGNGERRRISSTLTVQEPEGPAGRIAGEQPVTSLGDSRHPGA